MTLWQRVVQANRPGPPEHSVPFRVASAAAVVVAIAACWSQQELSPTVALFAIVATVVGNVLVLLAARASVAAGQAHPGRLRRRRLRVVHRHGQPHRHPRGHLHRGSTAGRPVRLGAVHPRLRRAGPAGRRLLAGRLGRTDGRGRRPVGRPLPRACYVVAWVACGLWGLVAMWQSMSGIRGVPWLHRGHVPVSPCWWWPSLLVALLPAPRASTSLIFPSSSGASSPVDTSEQPDRRLRLAARPRGQPQRSDGRRRLPGLRQVPRHRASGRHWATRW